MKTTLIVARFEIWSLLGKRSFWALTVLFPAFIMLLTTGGQFLAGGSSQAENLISSLAQNSTQPQSLGYVDYAGIIQTMPVGLSDGLLRAFPDADSAAEALAAGEIGSYFIIAADYVASGAITLVQREFQPLGDTHAEVIEAVLTFNLVGDANRAALIRNPLPRVAERALTPSTAADANASPLAAILPIASVMVLFFILVMSSGYMLRSVSREKENRTAEILLLSLRPRQLMLGKILGLSVVALLQMVLWLGAGGFFFTQGTSILQMVGTLQLPPFFMSWALLYAILGYFLYASLLGALGALAPSSREANQFSFAVLLPLMIPVWLNAFLVEAPNGTLAVALSLFPLTAPPTMIARLAAASVPLWQPILGVILLALTTYGAILLSAQFFRADTLLSTTSLEWRHLLTLRRN